jgi:hypothetical protein
MTKSSLVRLCTCLASLLVVAHCGAPGVGGGSGGSVGGSGGADPSGGVGAGGTVSSGGNQGGSGGGQGGSGGTVKGGSGGNQGGSGGGQGGSGGTVSSGGSQGGSGGNQGGSGSGQGGSGGSQGGSGGTVKGGSGGNQGGSGGGQGGSGGSQGGSGGGTVKGGSGGNQGGSGGGQGGVGGTVPSGGTTASGGTVSTGGTTAAPTTDCLGKALAKPGDSSTTSRSYLNLGDMRLINNRWGADELGCNGATYKVFVNSDKTFGYDFNRPTCGGEKAKPDYPEVEFGVAPFGKDSSLTTSPKCSSTTLLPKQIKDLTSATLNIEGFNSTYQNTTCYDTNFEFWISKSNPATSSDGGVFAEVIVFLGWDGTRMGSKGWPCENKGNLTDGSTGYTLCHQKDGWGSGWKFFNFNLNNGPQNSFSGKVNIKAFIDWVKNYSGSGITTDMWLTRIEVGTEVDDNTQGTATIKNLTFEINGTSKSAEFGQ